MTDIARGTVAVIGEAFHDDGNACGAVAFVGDAFICVGVALACSFLNDALNVVVRHIVRLSLRNDVLQLGVCCRVCAAAFFNGNGKLTADLCEDLRSCTVGLFFLSLNIIPLGMS